MKHYIILLAALVLSAANAMAQTKRSARILNRQVAVENIKATRADNQFFVGMDFCLDELNMPANRRVVLTPTIESGDNSVALQPIVINGTKQKVMYERRDYRKYPDAMAVTRKNGKAQSFSYQAQTEYADWMRNADIVMKEDLCGCGKLDEQESEQIKKMRQPKVAYIAPVAVEQKTYSMSGRAYVDFPVDRTELHPNYRNNPRELSKIVDTINIIKKDANMTITSIEIHGYASPEAPYKHNEYLAANRATTLKNYVRQLVKLDDRLFTVKSTAEDWQGLCKYIRESNLNNRNAILKIAEDNATEPDRREWLIKSQYPEEYRTMLATWYPALRHSDYVITCNVRPFSVEEAKQLIKTKPQLLSQNEMYMVAQTYEPGSKEFNEVFAIAALMYPDDPTANLNAACADINADKWSDALRKLDKAGDSAEADNARGVCYWQIGNEAKAIESFKKAADKGCDTARKNLEDIQ